MKVSCYVVSAILCFALSGHIASGQVKPDEINFVRQGAQRIIFDENQAIPLAVFNPEMIVGMASMHPVRHYSEAHPEVSTDNHKFSIHSEQSTQTGIWMGGFNPFATYTISLDSCQGAGEVGFRFSDNDDTEQFLVTVKFNDGQLNGAHLKVVKDSETLADHSIAVNQDEKLLMKGKVILQMLGSGLNVYLQDQGIPRVIGQSDFNNYLDLRKKTYLNNFQTQLFVELNNGEVQIAKATIALTTGIGQADIRAITYEDGTPLLDQGRLWYTMSIRGRALPHHVQGVFSMNPSVFDLKLEGVILFDRNDGLLRNEIASHIFYDRNEEVWRGLTTGFSAFAFPKKEKKQLLAVESTIDPRFGFSIMKAEPSGIVGDIEDPHVLFDPEVNKWRILTCENHDGYKAVILESDYWNKDYVRIAGPVEYNSTGTSIQKIGDQFFCFSGSSERKIFIYTYPDLKEAGYLQMDLPPWDDSAGTRVWPNVVQLPDGYPFKYVALMMDRYNFPGLKGPNWTYGALYLYHGN